MKKITIIILTLITCFMLFSCNTNNNPEELQGNYTFYMPDGAPALSIAKLMNDEYKKDNITYQVVSSDTIGSYVAKGSADIAILPINAAAKLCGDGEKYKLITINTHGNLFVISNKEANTIDDLKGKKFGVVNLANVPGLTFKAILKKNDISYTEEEEAQSEENVYLKNLQATEIAAALTIDKYVDFVVAPEPQVSALFTKTNGKIKTVFSLQTLWGEKSFPQACCVVKKELCTTSFIKELVDKMKENDEWIPANGQQGYEAISSHCIEGYQTTLNPSVLSQEAITGCNIKAVKASEITETIKDYLNRLIEIESASTKQISDNFIFIY